MISTRNVLFTTATLAAAASALQVASPASMVQCQPVQLSWSDGQAPFFVAIIPGSQPAAPALEQLPTQDGTSVTWMVSLAANQEVTIKVTDSTGAIQYSSAIPIQAGTSTECSSSATSGSSSGSGSSSNTGGSSSPASDNNDNDDDNDDDEASSSSAAAVAPARAASSAASSAPTLAMTRQTTSRPASSDASSSASTGRPAANAANQSGIPVAAASPSSIGAATSVKAGLGLLFGGLILALAA